MRLRITLGVLLAAALLSVAASCDSSTEPFNDAPRTGVNNDSPADVIAMPDGFNNLATKCDHHNRIYVSYHGDQNRVAIAVVAGDPTCR